MESSLVAVRGTRMCSTLGGVSLSCWTTVLSEASCDSDITNDTSLVRVAVHDTRRCSILGGVLYGKVFHFMWRVLL